MDYIYKLLTQENSGKPFFQQSYVTLGLAAYGFYKLASNYLLPPIVGSYNHFLRSTKDLKLRYSGEWALVTGASEGIGEALTYELAKRGFNVIMMARSIEKLEKVAEKV